MTWFLIYEAEGLIYKIKESIRISNYLGYENLHDYGIYKMGHRFLTAQKEDTAYQDIQPTCINHMRY